MESVIRIVIKVGKPHEKQENTFRDDFLSMPLYIELNRQKRN